MNLKYTKYRDKSAVYPGKYRWDLRSMKKERKKINVPEHDRFNVHERKNWLI